MISDEKKKVLGDRARVLGKLKEHPSWEELRSEFERKRERHEKRVAGLIIARAEAPIVQREIDYIAGFWAGAKWLLDTPDMAEESLKKALVKAERLRVASKEDDR